jgi:hypothetical protein
VVIVVLSLLALFGMIVLAVDVGALLLTRVAAQNSADSAALAAAISCGKKEGLATANAQATEYTTTNLSGSIIMPGYPRYSPTCTAPSGRVTVRVEMDRALYFAPALGFSSSSPVRAEATAVWGGAGAFEHVAPLMVSADRLHSPDCDIPPAVPTGPRTCSFWWDNSPARSDDPALSNAEWGTLDLLKWDVEPPVHCDNSTPPQFEEWMLEGYNGDLPISDDGTTYVCRGQGNFGASLDRDIQEAISRALPLYFPVNDPATQIDSSGNPCPPYDPDTYPDATLGCQVDKYNIVGFAEMKITGLWRGNRPEAAEFCGHVPGFEPDANARCMTTEWVGYETEGLDPQGGENFGLVPVKLVE